MAHLLRLSLFGVALLFAAAAQGEPTGVPVKVTSVEPLTGRIIVQNDKAQSATLKAGSRLKIEIDGKVAGTATVKRGMSGTLEPDRNGTAVLRLITPTAVTPKPPQGDWTTRGVSLHGADELGPLQPGQFALIVRDGNPYYAPLGMLRPSPAGAEPFGFEHTKRPIIQEEMNLLNQGLIARMDHNGHAGLLTLRTGEVVEASFVRVGDGKVHYLKPEDEPNKGLRADNPSRGFSFGRVSQTTQADKAFHPIARLPDNFQSRVSELDKVRQLIWPAERIGNMLLSKQSLAVSDGGKLLHHMLLIIEWRGPSVAAEFPVEINFANLQHPDQKPSSSKRVPYATGKLVSVGPDGATTVGLHRRDASTADDKEDFLAACPGYIRVIATHEGNEYVFDPRLVAFVHDARTAMPLTRSGLTSLPAERLKVYDELVARLLVPRSHHLQWAEIGPDDRVNFLNGYGKAWGGGNALGKSMSPQEKWDFCAHMSVKSQLTQPEKYAFYHDIVVRYGRPFRWADLSLDEQFIVHRHCERLRQKQLAADAKSERASQILIGSIALATAAWGAASEHERKVLEEAKTHTYKVGEGVRSLNSPVLGGWTGHVHSIGPGPDEYMIKITWAHPSLSPYKDILGQNIRMLRGKDFRPN